MRKTRARWFIVKFRKIGVGRWGGRRELGIAKRRRREPCGEAVCKRDGGAVAAAAHVRGPDHRGENRGAERRGHGGRRAFGKDGRRANTCAGEPVGAGVLADVFKREAG